MSMNLSRKGRDAVIFSSYELKHLTLRNFTWEKAENLSL